MKRNPFLVFLIGMMSLLFGCGESNYYKKSGKWHYDGVAVDGVNEPVNFKVIDNYFAKDDRSAFYRGSRIAVGDQFSDPASFTVLNTWYAKDKLRVYYCDTDRDSRDLWSVRRINIKVVPGADAASFRMMSDGYTPRDKSQVYYQTGILPIRDVGSFELLEHSFARDKIGAYYRQKEIAGSDSESFRVLDQHYARDKTKIYFVDGFYIGGSLQKVHLESFKALGDGYASDTQRGYYKGRVLVSNDVAFFENLNHMGYAKSRSQVFYAGQILSDADAASFRIAAKFDPLFDASDKLGRFRLGERVKPPP